MEMWYTIRAIIVIPRMAKRKMLQAPRETHRMNDLNQK
jgi:hypothetical protein